jgi:hypothetical protein
MALPSIARIHDRELKGDFVMGNLYWLLWPEEKQERIRSEDCQVRVEKRAPG